MSSKKNSEPVDWEKRIVEVYDSIRKLRQKPVKATSFQTSESIVTGFWQGDLSLEEAKRHLEKWRDDFVKTVLAPVPGRVVPISVNGKLYKTVIDQNGVQRFRKEALVAVMVKHGLDISVIYKEYRQGDISLNEYLAYVMGLGVSFQEFVEITAFCHLDIVNILDVQQKVARSKPKRRKNTPASLSRPRRMAKEE